MSRGSITTIPGSSETSFADKLAVQPRFSQLSWREKLSRFVYGTLGFSSVYHLLDNGLANFFALDILKHGTNIKSYVSINLTGADPKRGGTNQGVYVPGSPNCTNQFYVMPNSSKSGMTTINSILVPPMYTRMASANLLGHKDGDGGSWAATLLGVCTPTLRFKFRPEDVKAPRFEESDRIEGALYTTHSISPWRLGICGSLRQGIGLGMFQRMASHPIKVLSGVAMLGGAAYIGKRTYRYVTGQTAVETKPSVTQTPEKPTPPRQLMSPRKFALLCGLAQVIFRFGLSDRAEPLLVATSAAALGGIAYLGKQRYNAAKSAEKPQIPNSRVGAVQKQATRVASVGSTICGVFFRSLGAYWLGAV